jgi:flavodoxin
MTAKKQYGGFIQMKKAAFILLVIVFPGACKGEVQAQNQGRILIAYYSRTGNTRIVAEYIHEAVGGDLFEIETAIAYPNDYQSTTDIALQQQRENTRPELASNVNNMNSYDIIFLGYPIWWGRMPMFFFTFLESHDLSGKTIIPFCTYGSSGVGQSAADIQRSAPGATIREAFGYRGANANNSRNDVTAWLRRLGMTVR